MCGAGWETVPVPAAPSWAEPEDQVGFRTPPSPFPHVAPATGLEVERRM